MRHIANTIRYNTLYLLDDGTDTIEINEQRHRNESNELTAPIDRSTSGVSVSKKIETHVRAMYWDWRLAEAPSVTFFTTYELDIRQSDRLIRNDYSYLRTLAAGQRVYMANTVIVIGLSSVEDYIEMDAYLDFLSKVKEYFAGEKIIYVAHPRDSGSRVTRIREHLRCELWPSVNTIEYDLIVQGIKPKVVAGFVSSALITLAKLMDADVEIICFHIAPEHWTHWKEDTVRIYDYIKNKTQGRVAIVPLIRGENICKSNLL